MAEKWDFTTHEGEDFTRRDAVFQALGGASSCWGNLEGAGIFESDRCKDIGDTLLEKLDELDEPLLGLATTRELLNEVIARLELSDSPIARDVLQKFKDSLTNRALDYRTVDH